MYIVHSKYKYFIVNIPPTLTRPLDLDNIIPLLPIAAQSGFVNVREPNRLCNLSQLTGPAGWQSTLLTTRLRTQISQGRHETPAVTSHWDNFCHVLVNSSDEIDYN